MTSVFIEVTNGTGINWGKFLVSRFTPEEYSRQSALDAGRALLPTLGHNRTDILVVDLQTCEGAIFSLRFARRAIVGSE